MRGTKYRDVSLWIDSIDKLRSFNATFMVPSHTRPVAGQQNVSDVLTAHRNGIAYIYDQTIRQINKGLDPKDLALAVNLPPFLANNSWLQERYGQTSRMTKGIYYGEVQYKRGTKRGTETGLPASQPMFCIRIPITKRQVAKGTGIQSPWLDELNLRGKELVPYKRTGSGRQVGPALLGTLHGAKERILNTPTDILLKLARFNIDPEKSGDMNMTLGIKLNDTNEGYTLKTRKAVMEFQKSFPSTFDVAVYTNTDSLKKVIAGFTTLDDAVSSGQVRVDGDVGNLKKFVGVNEHRTGGTRTSIRR